MPKYVKCPRCDLNWMLEDQELCDVCKAELKLAGGITLLEDDDDDNICPYCGVNYLEPGEKLCAECKSKKQAKRLIEDDDHHSHAKDPGEENLDDGISVSFSDVESEEEEEDAWSDNDSLHYDEENFSDFAGDDELGLDELDLDEEDEEEEEETTSRPVDDFEEVDPDDVSFDEDDEEDTTDEDDDI